VRQNSTWLTWRHCLIGGLLAEVYTDPKKRTKLKPEAIWEIEGSLKLSALDIWRASVGRTKIYHAFRRAFERYDFLALPTAQLFPVRCGRSVATRNRRKGDGRVSPLDGDYLPGNDGRLPCRCNASRFRRAC
jgi:Asp-tRNA(Asn)/Glu-tRNA(Gln) amidotransferase A subunit family amidase